MPAEKNDILRQLKNEILSLQGFKPPPAGAAIDIGLGPIAAAFPNASFPTGAVHEFISASAGQAAATGGFIAGLLSMLMQGERACVWVSASRTLFPPALTVFGVAPHRIIFIDLPKERDVLWVMEEALKCEGLAAAVAEVKDISFTASRRLQLAVEHSRVTGFILRHSPRQLGTIACVSRWRITSLPSQLEEGMPGVGFPRWQVELSKIRNGRPGTWQIEWSAGAFHLAADLITSLPQVQRRKIG